jgi:hypothetical protein
MLVIAKLLEYNPYTTRVQVAAVTTVLTFFALSVLGYLVEGIRDRTNNLFRERNFTTTWYMYLLIVGEIGGLSVILWGFVETQML